MDDEVLVNEIACIIMNARNNVIKKVNTELISAYWNIGRIIVENELKSGREEYGKSRIINNLHNGSVILLHATSKDNSNILDDVIKETKKMGYEFRSLDQFTR